MLNYLGGANVIDKVDCKNKIYVDINEDLVCLLKYIKENPKIPIAPDDVTFEHYSEVREDKNNEKFSKEYRALIGYTATFGGKFFGGYGRESKDGECVYNTRIKNLLKQAPNLTGIRFVCNDYKNLQIEKCKNFLFYLDPPYKDTTKYSKQEIDYDFFYDFCRKLSEDNIVLISEYNMPNDFICIWSKDTKVNIDSNRENADKRTEKLFIHKKVLDKLNKV